MCGVNAATDRKRVFIVEDEVLISMEIKDRLENLGYAVCGSASRAEIAVEKIVALRPDVVLMDINLGGKMDGLEAADQVRILCGSPVVFLTAYSDPALIARAARVSAFGYLIKPFDERELLAAVEVACERKRAEETVTRLNQELEARVRERTANLEAFSYSVAHDLRAPLRGIDGYSRLLLEGYADKLDDTGRQFLGYLRRGAQQMDELIEDLLAYSHLDRQDMRVAPLDVGALFESLLNERAEEARRLGLAVTTALDFAMVNADRSGLAIALRNLLENAIKFMRDIEQPRIEFGGRDAGGTWVLWLRDNGPGFDMRYHDRIFGMFQRLHRMEDYPGTGVGLAMVKKAMERMGGRAWADSTPGEGATFYLEIPK